MGDLLSRLRMALTDRYAIERELGRGGMATVFLAEEQHPKRHVAIKVLDPEIAAVLGPERFLREVDLVSKLTHPHILPIYSAGEADGLLYYVMPYVEGQTLRDRLTKEKQLPVDDALQIAREVADALSFAHSRDVIHRDTKPENILLEAGHAVVADFGIARAINVAGGDRLTETGVTLGTPQYLSPEQAAGDKDLDGRSDLYSLGCVLYEMLAGQPPFTGPTAESVIRQHLGAEPPSITGVRPAVPASVAAALARALAKTPADRFPQVTSFAEAITPPVGVTPTNAPSVGTSVTWSTRLWTGMAVAGVLVALGVALLRPRGAPAEPNRILVVAFTDESGVEEVRALGRMAQDYIIQVLQDAGFADVVDPLTALAVSRQEVAGRLTASPAEVLALASEARAGTVVSGSYYATGDSIHVQTRITDARAERLLATVGPVEGLVNAPSELVARLGQEVVGALASLLDQELESWEPRIPPAAYKAYEAYSKGLQVYSDPADFAEAARHFERALAADSTFSRARLWAAQSYFLDSYSFGGVGGRSTNLASYAKAESLIAPLMAAREQLNSYERCRLDFLVAWGLQRSLSGTYHAARCMVQAAPGSDDARRELALFAFRLNRPAEAIELLKELDPDRGLMKPWGQGYWMYLADAYHMLGDYEHELTAARQARQRYSGGLWPLSLEARALAALGRLDAVAANVSAIRSLPPSWRTLGAELGAVALSLRAHDHRDAAREVLDETIAWYQSQPDQPERLRAELAEWLYRAERWGESQRLYERLTAESPKNTSYLAAVGRLAARRGDREIAARISEELRAVEHPHLERDDLLERARIAAVLGEREQAMVLLQQAIGQGAHFGYGVWLLHDTDFESMRDYPPFQEFTRPKG